MKTQRGHERDEIIRFVTKKKKSSREEKTKGREDLGEGRTSDSD